MRAMKSLRTIRNGIEIAVVRRRTGKVPLISQSVETIEAGEQSGLTGASVDDVVALADQLHRPADIGPFAADGFHTGDIQAGPSFEQTQNLAASKRGVFRKQFVCTFDTSGRFGTG
jgi:hypothetical protein